MCKLVYFVINYYKGKNKLLLNYCKGKNLRKELSILAQVLNCAISQSGHNACINSTVFSR